MRGGTLSMLILPKTEDECLCHLNHNECKPKWNQVTGRVRILALPVNFNGHKNIIQYQTCSNPGSLWYGFSFNKDCIDINTLESDWAGLQAGPDQVLNQQNTVFYCLIHWCISILKKYDAITHTKDSKFCYSVPDKHLLQLLIMITIGHCHLIIQDATWRKINYPRILRQTFPFLYKFGLNLTCPPPVVISLTRGGRIG